MHNVRPSSVDATVPSWPVLKYNGTPVKELDLSAFCLDKYVYKVRDM